jgi:hypothetical protein
MMQPGNVGVCHVADLLPADRRQDDAVNEATVLDRGSRLGLSGDMLSQESLGQSCHRGSGLFGRADGCRIAAVSDGAQEPGGFLARLLGRQGAMAA